jgi:ATP-binding cassette, subfamily B, bacterial
MGPRARLSRCRKLLGLARAHWRGYAGIWLLTLASSGAALLQPWPVQILIDHVLSNRPRAAWLARATDMLPGAHSTLGAAAWIALATLTVFALDALIDVTLTVAWLRVAQRGVYDLAARLFATIQRRSIAFHAVTPVGDSLARITGDSWCIYNAATALLFTPLHALAVASSMVVILARLNPLLTLIALGAAPVLAASTLALGRKTERAKGLERQVEVQIESHLQQTLSGMRVVQTFAQEEREHGRLQRLAVESVLAHRRSALLRGLSTGAAGVVTTVTTGLVLGLGAREVLRGALSIGQLLVFMAYLTTLNAQLVNLANTYNAARGLAPSIDRVLAALDAPPDLSEPSSPVRLPASAPGLSVRFEAVTFGYVPGRSVVRGIDLEIPAGATVGIVGESGAGKSTLAALVPRLVDPTEGRILIGGTDARALTLRDLRSLVAVVFQDPMLTADSIGANIAIGRPDSGAQVIRHAAEIAGLGPVLARLEHGLGTVLGESGGTLSGGERQRVALARALIRRAPILVLDEPTSALDALGEAELFRSLRAELAGATTLIIAHRLSTVRHADRIVVLHHGQIAEQGTHRQLLHRRGLYARLWSLQGRTPMTAAVGALA